MTFDEYADKYANLKMKRRDGILEVALHTDENSFVATTESLGEMANAWLDLADDAENKIVILTGTGAKFIKVENDAKESAAAKSFNPFSIIPQLLTNFLEIGVPVIVAVNGAVEAVSELTGLCEVVLLAEGASFQDSIHLKQGLPPTSGGNIVWLEVLGNVRGKYFLLAEQKLTATEAVRLGAANEILPLEELLPRAYQIAESLVALPAITLKNTREVLAQKMKRRIRADVGHGAALGNIALIAQTNGDNSGSSVKLNGTSKAFDSYAEKYDWVKFERTRSGVLLARLHTGDGSLSWGADSFASHRLFRDIADDAENKVVIFTGTGETFCTHPLLADILPYFDQITPAMMDVFFRNGPRSLDKQFEIPVPVILAVNGPASVHEEFFLGADIILASETATFQDGNHVASGFSIAGTQTFWEELLRMNRGKYFLLTGQILDAAQALEFGAVSEVVPSENLLARAFEHAERLAKLSPETRRAIRAGLNQQFKRRALDEVRMSGALFSVSNLDMGGPLAENKHPQVATV